MKKLNNKGFMLAETLVVAVAVSAIFSMIFSHFYPLMGEYEVRENYDDVDSKYGTYWVKRMIQDQTYNLDTATINNSNYVVFSCNNFTDNNKQNVCRTILSRLEVDCDNPSTTDKIELCNGGGTPHIIITRFGLTELKDNSLNSMLNSKIITTGMYDYIKYMPMYSLVSSRNGAEYRVIIEYYRHRFDNTKGVDDSEVAPSENHYTTYSNIEVIR